MKLVDKILEKVGIDRALHFLGGAWITLMGSPFGWSGIGWAALLAFAVSVFKEAMDEYFDWVDIGAALLGSAVSAGIYTLCVL